MIPIFESNLLLGLFALYELEGIQEGRGQQLWEVRCRWTGEVENRKPELEVTEEA